MVWRMLWWAGPAGEFKSCEFARTGEVERKGRFKIVYDIIVGNRHCCHSARLRGRS